MIITEHFDHSSLIPFYTRRGIEELTDYPNKPIFSYVIKEDDKLIGAATCSKENNIFILEAIAISEEHTGKKIGSKLLKKVFERLKQMGAEYVIINAKNTAFFEKNGFQVVDRSYAPPSEYQYCDDCPDYEKTCFPKIMRYKLEKGER